jgi:hypothetical protein
MENQYIFNPNRIAIGMPYNLNIWAMTHLMAYSELPFMTLQNIIFKNRYVIYIEEHQTPTILDIVKAIYR